MKQKDFSINMPTVRGEGEIRPLSMEKTREAESRLVEAKTVNVATYSELEFVFNESYRELKAHTAIIGFEIGEAQKKLANIKAGLILDKYPEFLKDKSSKFDNAEVRNAFVQRDEEYQSVLDTINTLEMLEKMIDGKIKVMERVTAYMKKQMDIVLRSGIDPKFYIK